MYYKLITFRAVFMKYINFLICLNLINKLKTSQTNINNHSGLKITVCSLLFVKYIKLSD